MATIAVGGFQHETNTFAPVKTGFGEFLQADGWPRLCRGVDLFKETRGVHLPITGALSVFEASGHDLYPLTWCSATPSSYVTKDAFERVTAMFIEDIGKAMRRPGGLDGIYLDLHGAMVCEHVEDGEGEFLRAIRELVGDELPIAVSLDLHANVTDLMVDHASVIDVFRTYPHVDMGETGARTARHLCNLLKTGETWSKTHLKTDFLIPLVFGSTYLPIPKELYENILPEILESDPSGIALSFACGFNLADIHDCGPSVIAYGETQKDSDRLANQMLQAVIARKSGFIDKIYTADECVAEAISLSQGATNPVIIADTQDNPGGGGTGDTTGLLRAMINAKAVGAVVGIFNDPETSAIAHEIGVGEVATFSIGGKLMAEDQPIEVTAKVLSLGDGNFKGTGPMWGGANFQMGPMALLEVLVEGNHTGIRVAIMSTADQTGDMSMFRHLGVEPTQEKIIGVKSSVHFRADFQPISQDVLVVAAKPGPVRADGDALIFKNLRNGIKLTP